MKRLLNGAIGSTPMEMLPLLYRCCTKNLAKLFFISFAIVILFINSCRGERGFQGQSDKDFSCSPPRIKVKVVKAVDGDTVILEGGERLRYAGINTLELHTESGKPEPFAKEAYLRNKELTEGKSFCLEIALRERDRYGRLLGELYFPNGTTVSEILVSEGLALVCYYEGSGKFFEKYLEVQRRAIERRVGLFSYLDRPSSQREFLGNKNSRRFHHPACLESKEIKKRVIFRNLEEALKAGYCPSRNCINLIFPSEN
ncbi:MAG: thermonuclease family protein [Caldimicrobium sp.]